MLRIRQLASVAVFAVCTLLAHSAVAAPPLIASASLNATATQVTIKGINFGPGTAIVILASTSLAIVSQSTTQIVATLPVGLAPGTYILIVQIGNKAGNSDRFAFTFAAAGPLRVLDGVGRQVGYNFDGETVQVLISGFKPVRLPVLVTGFVENPIDVFYVSPDCSGPELQLDFFASDPDLLVLDPNAVGVFEGKLYIPAALGSGYPAVTIGSSRILGGSCQPGAFPANAAPMTVIPTNSLGAPPFTVAP